METRVPARLTAAEGRRFGLVVGAAFLVLGALFGWRGRTTVATVLLSIGGLLAVSGLLLPSHLGPVQSAWMGFAHRISRITTPLLMGLVYFLVLTPTGLLRRTVGRNPLVHRPDGGTYWIPVPPRDDHRTSMTRQF